MSEETNEEEVASNTETTNSEYTSKEIATDRERREKRDERRRKLTEIRKRIAARIAARKKHAEQENVS